MARESRRPAHKPLPLLLHGRRRRQRWQRREEGRASESPARPGPRCVLRVGRAAHARHPDEGEVGSDPHKRTPRVELARAIGHLGAVNGGVREEQGAAPGAASGAAAVHCPAGDFGGRPKGGEGRPAVVGALAAGEGAGGYGGRGPPAGAEGTSVPGLRAEEGAVRDGEGAAVERGQAAAPDGGAGGEGAVVDGGGRVGDGGDGPARAGEGRAAVERAPADCRGPPCEGEDGASVAHHLSSGEVAPVRGHGAADGQEAAPLEAAAADKRKGAQSNRSPCVGNGARGESADQAMSQGGGQRGWGASAASAVEVVSAAGGVGAPWCPHLQSHGGSALRRRRRCTARWWPPPPRRLRSSQGGAGRPRTRRRRR